MSIHQKISIGLSVIGIYLLISVIRPVTADSPTPSGTSFIDLSKIYAPFVKKPLYYQSILPSPTKTPTNHANILGSISELAPTITEAMKTKIDLSLQVLGTYRIVGPQLSVIPINKAGSILIPTIGVNSPIVFDVSVNNTSEYHQALEKGVAHAQGTAKPSVDDSNTYLFAHSTTDERNIARYAAVFTKLNNLSLGKDIVTIFYENQRYDYLVVQKEIVQKFETSVLTRNLGYPALTLQTCDPPGQPLNRLIVTAKLIGVYDE